MQLLSVSSILFYANDNTVTAYKYILSMVCSLTKFYGWYLNYNFMYLWSLAINTSHIMIDYNIATPRENNEP